MKLTKFLPYLGAVLVFIVAALLYFNPVLSGKQIKQSDITQYIGMAKEMNEFRADKNEESYWLGNAFSGMPTYQMGAKFPNDHIKIIDRTLRFLPRPADYLFLYFIGFFLLLNALKVEWKLAILGSLTFGFSTYLIIIFGAGHNAKAHAIAYMPAIIAGVLYVFQKRYLLGFTITSLAMALEIAANHIQMTYYLGFCLLILGIVELIEAIKTKNVQPFLQQVGILLVAFIIGIGVNATRLLSTKEYAAFSTRGKSELTIQPDGTPKVASSGLDKSYITEYSYGKLETFNLLVPRFMGGGTVEKLGDNTNFYKEVASQAGPKVAREYSSQVLTYWGTQPIVEAPAYIGAIVIFLFFLGIFIVHGKLKYWLVSATILSIALSWGKNFSILTDFFIDYVPLYDKFRAVSSIQVIAELCIPLLGFLGLKEFFSNTTITTEDKLEALKKAVLTTGGLVLVGFIFVHMSSDFIGIRDGQYEQVPSLLDALISDRKSMLLMDSIRSIVLIGLSGGVLWLFLQNKIKQVPVLAGLTVLILFDLISVDTKYVNKEDFTTARKVQKPFVANKADNQILKDTSYYRVANFTANLMNEGRTSYFHKSIGGYHAAKMMRYQELFEYQMAKNNIEILNMLNVKYFILSDTEVKENTGANGNVWYVEQLKSVDSANEEIKELDSLHTKTTAIIRKGVFDGSKTYAKDSTATIALRKYDTNYLVYDSNAIKEQFAVFSEIYYKDGWNAYIDGELKPYYQVDYVLRGMPIPAGKHVIEFKFEPKVIQRGSLLSLLFTIALFGIPLVWAFIKRKELTF
ncbi:YfhO family protein [Tenacibaculum amylolyticum]|uniref:YfhO family protein n=1 Tax=Tenacibaculum amylolyticum TaxID=104269 RepID=UPI003892D865